MAETEYTRRDIESVAEKEWGRIDIVEAGGGGGSGDLKLCNITITNLSAERVALIAPFAVDDEQDGSSSTGQVILFAAGSPKSSIDAHVIAYKGIAQMIFADDETASTLAVDTTGDVEYNDTYHYFAITGDGTITMKNDK